MTDSTLQIGPFEIAEPIGEGGMGAVFRATHRRTGVDVAMKVTRGERPDEFRRQFHREVQAHAGLVHPGIVYLFDYGEIDEKTAARAGDFVAGSPWVAMELADVGTVRDLMPLRDWHRVRDILVQTLDALAHAHARDIVHRDLKPENLLVFDPDEGPRVKLADFGIAHGFDDLEDRATDQLEAAAGTPLYMAPEQIRGRWRAYGPWTDLYALGCIAYQLVCGRPPFVADNPVTLTVQHCTEDRPALEPRFPVPDGAARWILRAMAVEPSDRFRRAAHAARALPVGDDLAAAASVDADELESMETAPAGVLTKTLPATEMLTDLATTEIVATTTESSPASSARDGSGRSDARPMGAAEQPRGSLPDWHDYQHHDLPTPLVGTGLGLFDLRETQFVDRDDERQILWRALREVVEDGGFRLVLVSGESGTGKSRLVRWLVRRADELGVVDPLYGPYSPGGTDRTEGLRGLLQRAVRGWRLGRAELYERFFEFLPSVRGDDDLRETDARALTELVVPTDPNEKDVDGPRYQFDSPGQKYAVVRRFLQRLGQADPPLVWLDDLQWGPDALGLVEHLVETSSPPSGLVVATVRSDLLADRPGLADRLDELEEVDSTDHIRLESLGPEDHRALIDSLLGLEQQLSDRIFEKTEGNPLFAHQLVGELISAQQLELTDQGFGVDDATELKLPDNIHELWETRLNRLLDNCFPDRIEVIESAVELAAALGRNIDEHEWRVVCRDADLEVAPELVPELVRRGLVERTDDGWAYTHGMLVDSLEHRARRAGRWKDHHRRCARMLERRYPNRPHQTARRRSHHWIEAGEYRCALEPLFDENVRLQRLGDFTRQHRVLDRRADILERLEVPSDSQARLDNETARIVLDWRLGKREDPRPALRDVLERCRSGDVPETAARCLRVLATQEGYSGNPEAALEYYDRALEDARRADHDVLRGRIRLSVGWHLTYRGDFADARDHARRAAEVFGDDRPYFQLLSDVLTAWTLLFEGRFDESRRLFVRLLERAENRGARPVENHVANALGDCARYQGRIDQAREHYRQAMGIARETDSDIILMTGWTNLAQVELMARNFERCEQHLASIRTLPSNVTDAERDAALIDGIELALWAVRGDWTSFDDRVEQSVAHWPDFLPLARDYPWLLELTADYCEEAGTVDRATSLLEVARDMWEQLDDEAVERVEEKMP